MKTLKPKSYFSKSHLGVFLIVFAILGIIYLIESLAAPNPALPGDLNNDNTVNIQDLSILLSNYGTANATADINGDGTVNVLDMSTLLSHYGQTGSGTVWTFCANEHDQCVFSGTMDVRYGANGLYVIKTFNGGVLCDNTVFGDPAPNVSKQCYISAAATSGTGTLPTGVIPVLGLLRYNNIAGTSNVDKYVTIIASVQQGRANSTELATAKGKVLTYTNASIVSTSQFDGVTYSDAAANGWLAKDSNDNYITNQYGYLADIGNTGYQQAWAANVANMLAQVKADGAFIDNVSVDYKEMFGGDWCGGGGAVAAKYPNRQAWMDASKAFYAYADNYLRQRGYYVMGNAGAFSPCDGASNDASLTVTWWNMLSDSTGKSYFNNLFDEYWLDPAPSPNNLHLRISGTEWYNNWDKYVDLVNLAQNLGADFTGEASDEANNLTQVPRYTRASLMLNWDGKSWSAATFNSVGDPWYDGSWEVDLGTPSAAKIQVGLAWKRIYSKGEVIVNPTSSSVTVDGHTIGPANAYIGP